MVGERRRESSEHVRPEGEIPGGVAESPVKLDKGRVGSLIAPGEFPVLQLDLLKLADVQGLAELAHQAEIEVGVAFVRGLVYKVEITNDEPFVAVCRGLCNSFVEEGSFVDVSAGPYTFVSLKDVPQARMQTSAEMR